MNLAGFYVPYFSRVFVNRTVGRESAGIGDIQSGGAQPAVAVGITGINFVVSVDIGVEVFKDKEFVVALYQIVANGMEIAEGTVGKLIDYEACIGIGGVFVPDLSRVKYTLNITSKRHVANKKIRQHA